jgi:hypothetical protein
MRRRWPTSWSCAVWLVVNFGERRLRTHGLIKRVGRTYKYYVTKIGRAVALAGLKRRSLVLIPELASAAAT